jgi:hypothetical protein
MASEQPRSTGRSQKRPPTSPKTNRTSKKQRKGKKPARSDNAYKTRKSKGSERAATPPWMYGQEDYADNDDPCLIIEPVASLIHPKLHDAWRINNENPMWFIFDSCSPARHFQRGNVYSDEKEFPDYSEPPYDDLTETDEPDGPGLMQFAPWAYSCVTRYHLCQPEP